MGHDHLRYVDDIRIFCRDLVEAKKVLIELARLLRKRGLNLQAAKSEIYRADQAREEIEGVATVLKSVRDRFISEVVRETGLGDPYITVPEADEILEKSPEEAPIEIIEDAYQSFFIDSTEQFNPTLFRFLLSRLGRQRDAFAGDHCLTLFEGYPEETQAILDYHARIESAPESALVEFLNSDRSVYDYQNYQILEFFLERIS